MAMTKRDYDSNSNKGTFIRVEITGGDYSIPNNRTPVAWKIRLKTTSGTFAGQVQTGYLKINGTTVWNTPSSISALKTDTWYELGSGTLNVNHNSNGKKTIAIEAAYSANAGGYGPVGLLINESLVLDDIPRVSQSTLNYSSRVIGQTVRINTNRVSNDFNHSAYYKVGNDPWVKIGEGADYIDWKLPDTLAWTTLTMKTGTAEIYVETYLNGNYLGRNSNTLKWTIPDEARFRPNASITSISNLKTMPSGFGQIYVQGISEIQVQTSDSGVGGSSIVEREIEIDGNKFYTNQVNLPVFSAAGTKNVKITVKDSRGFTNSSSSSFYITPYTRPKINSFVAERLDSSDTTIEAKMSAEVHNISGNTGNYQLHSRVKGSDNWGNPIFTLSGLSLNTSRKFYGYDSNTNYEFKLTVYDKFGIFTTTYSAGTAFQLINFRESGKGIAFGKVSEKDEVEIAMPVDISDNLKVSGSIAANGITSYGSTLATLANIPTTTAAARADNWIHSTGSDSYATWIKFSNGMMVQWDRSTLTVPNMRSDSTTGLYNVVLPRVWFSQDFVGTLPHVDMKFHVGEEVHVANRLITLRDFTNRFYAINNMSGSREYSWFAIGRWK